MREFENKYVKTLDREVELYKFFFWRSGATVIMYILFAIELFSSIINICSVIFLDILIFDFSQMMGSYSYLIVLVAMVAFSYFYGLKRRRKLFLDYVKEPTEVTIRVDESFLHFDSTAGNCHKIKLGSVKKVYLTKNYIYISTKSKNGYALKKDSFTKGSEEEFYSFLRSNKIRVKKK